MEGEIGEGSHLSLSSPLLIPLPSPLSSPPRRLFPLHSFHPLPALLTPPFFSLTLPKQEARMRLTTEKHKQKLETEAEQIRRKLENETNTRKELEFKLNQLQHQLATSNKVITLGGRRASLALSSLSSSLLFSSSSFSPVSSSFHKSLTSLFSLPHTGPKSARERRPKEDANDDTERNEGERGVGGRKEKTGERTRSSSQTCTLSSSPFLLCCHIYRFANQIL